MSEVVVPAVVALAVALLTSLGTFWLQRERLRTELRTQFMAEAAIVQLLEDTRWRRSFAAIQHRIDGFGDDELRQLLVRAGAVRFRNEAGEELWGLRRRNIKDVDWPPPALWSSSNRPSYSANLSRIRRIASSGASERS
jgi:hypothetical protein